MSDIFKATKEMKEIIKFFNMKDGYWLSSLDKSYPEYPITLDLFHYIKFIESFIKNENISINYTFTILKESNFLNNFMDNQQMSIEELSNYDFDIAYFIASRKAESNLQKRELLQSSILCKNGEILVPEAFSDLISLEKINFDNSQKTNDLLKIFKYVAISNLVTNHNVKYDEIGEISTIFREEENTPDEFFENESILNYLHIFKCTNIDYFPYIVSENYKIQKQMEQLEFNYPEKFVNVTIRSEITNHIKIPFINTFK